VKRILALLGCVTLVSLLCCAALLHVAAGQTGVSTEVPANHTLYGTVTNGSVVIDGKTYTGTFSLQVPHGASVTLHFHPDDGHTIGTITMDGNDISGQLNDGAYTIEHMVADAHLIAEFVAAPSPSTTPSPSAAPTTPAGPPPITGDQLLAMMGVIALTSAAAIIVLVVYRRRTRTHDI